MSDDARGGDMRVAMLLLAVARAAYYALEDSEERGEGHLIQSEQAIELQAALDALDELPAEPGYASCGPNNAAYALRAQSSKETQ